MITRVVYKVEVAEGLKFDYNWGSVFHGLIMEIVDTDYAEVLHDGSINPFSQYCYYDKNDNSNYLVISCLNVEATQNIIDKLEIRNKENNNYFLKNKNTTVKLVLQSRESISYKDLLLKHLLTSDVSNITTFNLVTPTGFKSNGKYINFPDSKMVYSSIIRKWDTFCEDTKLYDEKLLDTLDNYVSLNKYNLRSTQFYLEQTKIPSMLGYFTFKQHTSIEVKKLCQILNEFATYCGIGIKCSVGMGGVRKV